METDKSTNNFLEPAELKNLLSEKTQNLFFPSESDRPIEVVSLGKASDVSDLLTVQGAASDQAMASGSVSFEDFYAKYGVEKEWQNSVQKEFATEFGSALKLMRDNLNDVQIIRAGQVEVTILIAGQTQNGEWIGLKTVSVETGE